MLQLLAVRLAGSQPYSPFDPEGDPAINVLTLFVLVAATEQLGRAVVVEILLP